MYRTEDLMGSLAVSGKRIEKNIGDAQPSVCVLGTR